MRTVVAGAVLASSLSLFAQEQPKDFFDTRSYVNETYYCYGDEPAIDLTWPVAPSVALPTATIQDVRIIDAGLVSDAFGNHPFPPCKLAVRLENAWNSRITRLTCWGLAMNCIELHGASNDSRLEGVTSYSQSTPVHIGVYDTTQGVTIDSARLVGGETGIVINTIPGNPGAWIHHSHINTTTRGVIVKGHPQNLIDGNLVYRLGVGSYAAFEIGSGADNTILRNNIIHCGAVAGVAHWKLVAALRVFAEPTLNDVVACR